MEKNGFFRVLDNLYDAVYMVDQDRKITYWNDGAEALTGYGAGEMVGADCKEKMLAHLTKEGEDLCETVCALLETDSLNEIREREVYIRHREGHLVPAQGRMIPLRDEAGKIVAAAEIFSDRSVSKEIEKRVTELERLARLDVLTRLPNRKYVEEEIAAHLAELERFDRYFGVMAIDLDQFEKINTKFGRDSGDEALKMIARTWFLSARPFDTVGRWEEDTFMVLAVQLDRVGLRAMADRFAMLLSKLLKPWDQTPLGVGAAIGATMVYRGDSSDTLIDRAMTTLEQAKFGGEGRLIVDESQ